MKLEEKHKQFAVKCYARFLTRTEVVEAFLEEFADDLPPPPEYHEFSEERYRKYDQIEREEIEEETAEDILYRDQRIAEKLANYQVRYEEAYGTEGTQKFEADREKLREQCIQDWYETPELTEDDIEEARETHDAYRKQQAEKHHQQTKRNISRQLRRLNIIHRQFPEKYRALFNQAREQYFNDYRGDTLAISENVLKELEILIGYVKQCIFEQENQTDAMKFMTLAHQIMKTVIAHNALSGKQEVVDITPQSVKALTDSQKALTDQLKKVTQQLTEHTDTPKSKNKA